MEAVPQGLHDGHADIVEDNGEHPAEVDPEIDQGVGQDGIRRIHGDQQLGDQQQPRRRGEYGGDDAEQEGGVDGPGHVFLIPRAVIPGDHHASAHGDAVEEADDQKGEVPPGADGGEGPVVGEIPQHPGVRHVVELLKELAQQHGQGEGDDAADDGALGEGGGAAVPGLLER